MDPARCRSSRRRRGLPRTRGDGPRSGTEPKSPVAASPHTRGWTPGARVVVRPRGGFPAHAGMDPADPAGNVKLARLPRTRGDGPARVRRTTNVCTASPHTRGWTRAAGPPVGGGGGFPAHAGMDPSRARLSPRTDRLPRTRGDGPWPYLASRQIPVASPHTRGWTPRVVEGVADRGGFPAHAGMDPRRRPRRLAAARLPRTRGDGPTAARPRRPRRWASPHTRGWPPEIAGLVAAT